MAGVGYLEGKRYLLFQIALKLDWYRENICKNWYLYYSKVDTIININWI